MSDPQKLAEIDETYIINRSIGLDFLYKEHFLIFPNKN